MASGFSDISSTLSGWRPDLILSFADGKPQAAALAQRLGVPHQLVEVHTFPDRECKVRVQGGAARVALYRPLNDPNAKLIELILAAGALRANGATDIALIAPYLPYMRQDIAFQPGEAVSQKIIGHMLAQHFDRVVAVDPHLHRTPTLAAVFQGKPALALTGADAIAAHLSRHQVARDTVVLGPDVESAAITRAVAEPLKLTWATGLKTRHGDRDVKITLPPEVDFRNKPVIIVDDVISSGATVAHLSQLVKASGASSVEVYATHALFDAQADATMRDAGVTRILSCDGVAHPSNGISVIEIILKGLNAWPSP